MPARFNSEIGRMEYLVVNLIEGPEGPSAHPFGKGSGSVTTSARADGFVSIPRDREFLEDGQGEELVPLGRGREPASLVAIESYRVELDWIPGQVHKLSFPVKSL